MRLRNKMKCPLKIVIRTNLNEKVNIESVNGEVLGTKAAPARLKTIHIGQGCEVEIDDSDWAQAWNSNGKAVSEFDEVEEVHLNLTGADKKKLTLIKREATVLKTVYPYRDLVKDNMIEITEKPKPLVSNKEMTKSISEALGVEFKPKNEEHLFEMFEKVIG